MTRTTSRIILFVAVVLLSVTATTLAQSGDGYELSWWTVDGGGHTFRTDREYTLGGTVGQPDSGVLTNGVYTLVGGFWGVDTAHYPFYLPLVLRDVVHLLPVSQ